MADDMRLLEQFNALIDEQATIYERKYLYDTDGATSVNFYKVVSRLDTSIGVYRLKYLGSFNEGAFFREVEPEKLGFVFSSYDSEIEGYPMSENSISVGEFRVDYKSSYIKTDIYKSTVAFARYWESDFEKIQSEFPQQAQEITKLLEQEIRYLAAIQKTRGYKSAWVFYRYMDELKKLTAIVNSNLLKDTCYFYSPLVYFNKYSPRLVSLTSKEDSELKRQQFFKMSRWD